MYSHSPWMFILKSLIPKDLKLVCSSCSITSVLCFVKRGLCSSEPFFRKLASNFSENLISLTSKSQIFNGYKISELY